MAEPLQSVGPPVVQRVLKVASRERLDEGHLVATVGAPEHLLQLTTTGRVTIEVNGRRYEASPGTLIWYHETEDIQRVVHEAPWRYLVVNFIAPTLNPPPFEMRSCQIGELAQRRFERLLRIWNDNSVPPAIREMRVHASLLEFLIRLSPRIGEPFRANAWVHLWWSLEGQLRKQLTQRPRLADLAAMTGKSPATIARSCLAAVGTTPMKRLKHIRMSVARNLVASSDLQIKEIAARLGYERLHEFSRDYRRHFGQAPTSDGYLGSPRRGRKVNR